MGRGKKSPQPQKGAKAEGKWKKDEKKGKKSKSPLSSGRGAGGKAVFTPKGAKEWAKYFEGQVESQPFYNEFAKKKGKKKRK